MMYFQSLYFLLMSCLLMQYNNVKSFNRRRFREKTKTKSTAQIQIWLLVSLSPFNLSGPSAISNSFCNSQPKLPLQGQINAKSTSTYSPVQTPKLHQLLLPHCRTLETPSNIIFQFVQNITHSKFLSKENCQFKQIVKT